MTTGSAIVLLFGFLTAVPAFAQEASAPGEPLVPPGVPPDERVDVTGDGVADLVISGRIDRIPDPEQGLDGWYRRGVRALPGSSILLRCTPNSNGYYRVSEGSALDTAAIRKGVHFKQLCWSEAVDAWKFGVLEQPFGPGIQEAAKGWFGMGEHNQGTLVLRSVMGPRTAIAAFQIRFNLPAGRIWVTPVSSVIVNAHFTPMGEPPPAPSRDEYPFSIGQDVDEHQVMVPPGLPADEPIDLTSDDVPDVMITSEDASYHSTAPPLGTYFRGLRVLPGAALLMTREQDGSYRPFQLMMEQELNPTQLAMGLQGGLLRWADPAHWQVMVQVLKQRYGSLRTADEPAGWIPANDPLQGALVFRATQYGRSMIGCFEVDFTTPGGELWINLQGLVDDGAVLKVQ